MAKNTVTVIIDTYNPERFIEEAMLFFTTSHNGWTT
jgi:hypothetical protein